MSEHAPLSRTIASFWCFVGIMLWWFLAGRNANLLVSAAMAVGLLFFITSVFDRGAWHGFCRIVLRDGLAHTWFWIATVTAMMVASVIAGDWGPEHKIPSTCLGPLHLHHWAKGLICLGLLAIPLEMLRREECDTRALRRYGGGLLLLAAAGFAFGTLLMMTGHGNLTVRVDAFAYAMYFVMLGLLLRSSETNTQAFRVCIAMSIGIAFGIALQGGAEILRDFSKGGIPESLIFWHSEIDPKCF